jgi:hypothetical protein
MFSFSIHTSFIKQNLIKLSRKDLDKASKDNKHIHFLPNFSLDLFFRTQDQIDEEEQDLLNELATQPTYFNVQAELENMCSVSLQFSRDCIGGSMVSLPCRQLTARFRNH